MFAIDYHEATKHYFDRFARSAGRLDWATQPDPFRTFAGTSVTQFRHQPVMPDAPYESIFTISSPSAPFDDAAVGDFLRCALGLTAWKRYQTTRWALRANPSSGNLHPTEGYIVWRDRVWHYRPREHAIEERCHLSGVEGAPGDDVLIVGLSSIFWREAWKYGERAFRYCQHDTGHAIGALAMSAARLGWRMALVPWRDSDIATLLGLDRDDDFDGAEREAPECLAVVTRETRQPTLPDGLERVLLTGARNGVWAGQANRLSPSHVEWRIIEQVAVATDFDGHDDVHGSRRHHEPPPAARPPDNSHPPSTALTARAVMLQRRSAVAFDAHSSIPAAGFVQMLERLRPSGSPWDGVSWPAQVNLAVFVHRVDGLTPGLYAFGRTAGYQTEWRAAMRQEFLWEPVMVPGSPSAVPDLFLLLPIDARWPATRLSCDQDIAGDGFFSLGMVARFEPALRQYGEWFYRRLFWEAGLIGQVLYLEAEAAGARATGIGCYYDDPVHEVLGISDRSWQSLYHFSMGIPVEDGRLVSEESY
jgi:SagB-type dehydrogenase family enzyme